MIYSLLGQLEVGRDDRLVELPGGHSLIVLAALLLNVNHPLSKTELLRVAWGSPDVSEAQIHKSVGVLRALLDQVGRRDDLVTHARHGYELRVTRDEDLDMLLFQRLLRAADEAGMTGRMDEEVDVLRRALRLWRGPHPLSNVPTDAFRREIDGLGRRRKRAAVRLFDLEIARGNHEGVLDDLLQISTYAPTDRRLCEQLMLVAYRCGHGSDSVEAYERHAAALAAETGGTPDPTLRRLYYAVANGDEAVVATVESAIGQRLGVAATIGRKRHSATPSAAVPVPRQLPPDPPDFVNRGDLVAEASRLLTREPGRTVPIIVISGPGGIGKTALARRVAHLAGNRYPDGQLYVELRGTVGEPLDVSEVLAQFLRAFGVPAVPDSEAERISMYRTLLAEQRVLVVLDDAATGAQIRDLIPANPGCAVLVTSRRRLPEIAGAHHVPPLEPLDHESATELFLRVAVSSGIDLSSEAEAVDQVVRLCGGLPLALRIAGALRVHDHPRPTAELVERLARQGPEAFAYGEHSVVRAIDAGFDRLDEDARRLFLGLGLLQLPSFGLWTAAVLLDGTGVDPAATLSRLAASNMIELVESEVRYRFHDLTRDYAHRRALSAYADVRDRNAKVLGVFRALLTLARTAHAALYGGAFEVVHSDEPDWVAPPMVLDEVTRAPLGWFEKERLNIRAAVDRCAELKAAGICWDLAVSAHEFYTVRGYFGDWYATHQAALRACQDAGDTRGEGVILACLGQPALVASRREGVSGLPELERSVNLLVECGDRHGQAIALRTLANALRRGGHSARPLALFRQALACYEASQDTVGTWQSLRFIGQTHLDLGEHDEALAVLHKSVLVARTLGQPRLLAQTTYWVGQTCLARGDLAGAALAFETVREAYPEATGIGHAYAMHGLGDVACRTGAYEEASRRLAVAAELAREGADAVLEGRVHVSLAALHAALSRPGEQIAALRDATACFAACGAGYLEVQALVTLAETLTRLGDEQAARSAWDGVDDRYAAMGVPAEDRLVRRPDSGR
ncbi:BTAD domain-containing putative transcriptional regulator [Micromonospora sp. NPDC047467]|uniref:AfsR/SARP family transcriptional regulator n=1 Tax=Micromonospora sp. NPDC047467 TaxID=3154814 RepID=UPI0033DA786E